MATVYPPNKQKQLQQVVSGNGGAGLASVPGTTPWLKTQTAKYANQPVVPQSQVAADQINQLRQQLISHGYDVDKTGGANPRFNRALTNFQKTKGAGAKMWNHHDPRTAPVAPAFTPSTATPPGLVPPPTHVTRQSPNDQTPLTIPRTNLDLPGTGQGGADNLPDPSKVTSGYTDAQLQQLHDQLTKQFAFNGTVPQLPTIDPTMAANAKASMEYGPVIAQLNAQLKQYQGAEPGAQQNISDYFAPVLAAASKGAADTNAVAGANAASQAALPAGVASALGLSGAAASGINSQGTTQADFAKNLASILQAQGAGDVQSVGAAAANAHENEAASNTNDISTARQSLLAQLAAKGSAAAGYKDQYAQQNFANQTQNVANKANVLNQKVTSALAIPQIVAAMQGIKGTQQTQETNATTLPYQVRAENDAHNTNLLSQDVTKINARNNQVNQMVNLQKADDSHRYTDAEIHLMLHPNNASKATTFDQVDVGTKEKLAQYLRQNNRGKNPQQAYSAIAATMAGRYGYKGADAKAFAQNIVDTYWAHSNPNWGWNAKTGSYTKRK